LYSAMSDDDVFTVAKAFTYALMHA
jgi:hypothetical protein